MQQASQRTEIFIIQKLGTGHRTTVSSLQNANSFLHGVHATSSFAIKEQRGDASDYPE